MKTGFLFPGQGAQQAGMGKDLYEAFSAARSVFDRAEEVSRLPLKRLCFEGPEEELSRTDIAQPAIFTVSVAALGCLASLLSPDKVAALRPAFMAGLSLGEYTALFAAGMVGFDDALRLVARRGRAMQEAATAVSSGMVSVMGLDESAARRLCRQAAQGQVLTCANFNAPGQIVLSGELSACQRVQDLAGQFGASGAIPLKVAGAFHSPLMQPAAQQLRSALDNVRFQASSVQAGCPQDQAFQVDHAQEFAHPAVQVIANVDAQPYEGPSAAADKLLAQLIGPVRWQQSMEYLLGQGVGRFYEIGPGRVLAGLMRRINRQAAVISLNSKEAIEKLASA